MVAGNRPRAKGEDPLMIQPDMFFLLAHFVRLYFTLASLYTIFSVVQLIQGCVGVTDPGLTERVALVIGNTFDSYNLKADVEANVS